MLTVKRIVAPTDFSRHSELSLEAAVEMAQRFGAELHVLHIVVPQIYQSEMPEMMMPPFEDLTEDMLGAARRRMDTWRQGVPKGLKLETHVIESTRKEDIAICEFAGKQAAEVHDETAGPYPGDGSNGANALDESGIVRRDITSSFGTSSTRATGIPLTVNLTVTSAEPVDDDAIKTAVEDAGYQLA